MSSNTRDAYIYHVIRHTDGVSDTEIPGTYTTSAEARAAAFADIVSKMGAAPFPIFDWKLTEDGDVLPFYKAECPEGRMIRVCVEKKAASKSTPRDGEAATAGATLQAASTPAFRDVVAASGTPSSVALPAAATPKPETKPARQAPARKEVWIVMKTVHDNYYTDYDDSHPPSCLAAKVAFAFLREANHHARQVLYWECEPDEEDEDEGNGNEDDEEDGGDDDGEQKLPRGIHFQEKNIGSSTEKYVGDAYYENSDDSGTYHVHVEVENLSFRRLARQHNNRKA
ncbi:hypothetical protein FB45DRAFT_1094913 [Roridomyces roridus]|uniref:Uncharacterized protein n=1 Tax=Roridomyces roridus TaxID=1738132 RepID=A0AAD7F5R7_9AGAR|nr:hypothetical protein FB45DRAFT_1094913 [Roridomyces roridus]